MEVESIVRNCVETSVDCEDSILDKEIDLTEISRCIRKLKNNKTGGSDGLVGELLKYGGSPMVNLLQLLFPLFGVKRWYIHNGVKTLLLICLRKVIKRNQVITEV